MSNFAFCLNEKEIQKTEEDNGYANWVRNICEQPQVCLRISKKDAVEALNACLEMEDAKEIERYLKERLQL